MHVILVPEVLARMRLHCCLTKTEPSLFIHLLGLFQKLCYNDGERLLIGNSWVLLLKSLKKKSLAVILHSLVGPPSLPCGSRNFCFQTPMIFCLLNG